VIDQKSKVFYVGNEGAPGNAIIISTIGREKRAVDGAHRGTLCALLHVLIRLPCLGSHKHAVSLRDGDSARFVKKLAVALR